MIRRFASTSLRAKLNYSKVPPSTKQLGRYINRRDVGDVMDEFEPSEVEIRDAREWGETFHSKGFECRVWPTQVKDFTDTEEVREKYYAEMQELLEATSGAAKVFVFDHTIREAGASSLNTDDPTKAAATVARVHTDYTARGAPRRLEQLVRGDEAIWDGNRRVTLGKSYLNADYAFINVWRSIDKENLVYQRPMAFLDEDSVDEASDVMTYELRFPKRTGETYALRFRDTHRWYYYPRMSQEECVVFKGFDRRKTVAGGEKKNPRFVYHTAFDDPTVNESAPPRKSIEVRMVAFFPHDDHDTYPKHHSIFYDMHHSNNAARVRLWLDLASKLAEEEKEIPVSRKVIQYGDLRSEDYPNPLRKVPALVEPNGDTVFESDVILRYLEDKFGSRRLFTPNTAEGRQKMDLIIRCHDLYVASPNCTAPGFSHSQGSMYLSEAFHGPDRAMDANTRAAKLHELWKQLSWLDTYIAHDDKRSPYLVKSHPTPTLADFTWYPTCVFMEFMLPKIFQWPTLFDPATPTPTPRVAKWYDHLTHQGDPAFRNTRATILDYWNDMERKGQFKPILDEIARNPDLKWQYP
mmetsp:Transcript_24908/g.80598  ORF Transcript_24908/g.80598 Transcript_24908/m.80598 type:complete len:579 (+) Transcript_24908:79-1815(+)